MAVQNHKNTFGFAVPNKYKLEEIPLANLVILESPSKAKTVKKYLGAGYDVMASTGHIIDLPKSKFGVDVDNNFEPQYVNMKDKSDIIKELKNAPRKATSSISQRTRSAREKLSRGICRIC